MEIENLEILVAGTMVAVPVLGYGIYRVKKMAREIKEYFNKIPKEVDEVDIY